MATKWKNIGEWKRFVKTYAIRFWRFVKKYRRYLIGGAAMIFGGLFFLDILESYYYDTYTVWFRGMIANVCCMLGVTWILPKVLADAYRNWLPEREEFYEEWKRQWKKLQKILLAVLAAMLLACMLFWNYQRSHWNYARGYLAYASAVFLWVVAEVVVIRFLQERLNMLMERMSEINQERLKEALEIEKSSLEKVSRSDQLRVDLITNVSHDLKTPLTSMVGYLELLKKEELGDTARDYLEVISGRATKLKEMIDSLFSLAKASSGNIELHMETIELNLLLEQIFADMDDRMAESELEFVKLYAEADTHMVTDNAYMYRICQNLLENALKYSAKGTRVFVKTGILEDGRLSLEITNTAGYKMDFAKEDIVERFARADKARSSEGNGLGLAIVSSYTKALGGDFDILLDCDQFKVRLNFPPNVPDAKP